MSAISKLALVLGLGVAVYFFISDNKQTPKASKSNEFNSTLTSSAFVPSSPVFENPTATLANTSADQTPMPKADNLSAKQTMALAVLSQGSIPVNPAGAIIADTIYQGRPVQSQQALEYNIALKYGEATPIERTADPLTSIVTLVGGQTTTVGRSPTSDAEKLASRRANLNTFSEADKQTESYKKADAKLKKAGY